MIVPGLRFEHIELKQRDFGSDDPTRSSPPGLVKNKEDVLIPAIGVNYMFTDNFTGFAGVHKGFGPPSPGSTASVEESINYETGLRFVGENNLFLEGVLFLNDYSNLVGTDSSADGAEFNGGKVQSYGIELVGSYDFIKRIMGKSVIFPIKVTYGYNHSEFKTSLNSSQSIEEWGNVSKGDLLPYVSPHQFSISVGAEIQKFNINLSTKYVDAMRTTASRGKIAKENKIPSHFVADTTIFYQLKHDIQLFTAVDNIFNRKYAVASRPAGYRPGKPLTFRVGAKIDF
jgi:Fe(3+) dicitrate transport protein